MATIHDVAKLAGVSSATVSRAMNNEELVAKETRERVKSAIEELEYSPNQLSIKMRKQESKVILVMIPDFRIAIFGSILKGMDDAATKLGYQLLVTPTYKNRGKAREAQELANSKHADGAILVSQIISPEELEKISLIFPIVQCCEYIPNLRVSHVSINDFTAAYQVMSYFIGKGYRKIVILSVDKDYYSSIEREAACYKAFEDNNIECDEFTIKRGEDYTFESGVALTQELLISDDLPSAIFAFSDTLACGCLRVLLDAGYNVPTDIELIGFDNVDIAQMVTPPLSTVAQPLAELGKTAVNMLVAQINGKTDFQQQYLAHEIIFRQTTK